MPNLRKIMLMTVHSKTPVRVYDETRKTFLVLNIKLGSSYPGETHVNELAAGNGEIYAYTNLSAKTINRWKAEYGCD